MIPTAKRGDLVRVHYTGTLDDGTIFDSSQGGDPLEFELGSGQVIPGFEQMVEGMTLGETRKQRILTEDAYGPARPELVARFERTNLPPGTDVEVGDQVQLEHPNGGAIVARVVETTPDAIVLDANHELAGQALTFQVELFELQEPR
jgi:peptidylprolyl isomerase